MAFCGALRRRQQLFWGTGGRRGGKNVCRRDTTLRPTRNSGKSPGTGRGSLPERTTVGTWSRSQPTVGTPMQSPTSLRRRLDREARTRWAGDALVVNCADGRTHVVAFVLPKALSKDYAIVSGLLSDHSPIVHHMPHT